MQFVDNSTLDPVARRTLYHFDQQEIKRDSVIRGKCGKQLSKGPTRPGRQNRQKSANVADGCPSAVPSVPLRPFNPQTPSAKIASPSATFRLPFGGFHLSPAGLRGVSLLKITPPTRERSQRVPKDHSQSSRKVPTALGILASLERVRIERYSLSFFYLYDPRSQSSQSSLVNAQIIFAV